MEYVARKITPAKWKPQRGMAPEDIGADAVMSCLRTSSNALSIWECDASTTDDSDVKEVVLALSTELQHVQPIAVVVFEKGELVASGFRLEYSEGKTAVEDLRKRHMDIVDLNMQNLERVAVNVAAKCRQPEHHRIYHYSQRQVIDLLVIAISKRRLNKSDLHDSLQQDINKFNRTLR